jgi:hypothetical protein
MDVSKECGSSKLYGLLVSLVGLLATSAQQPDYVGDNHRSQNAQDSDNDQQLNQGKTFLASI